MRIQVAQMYLYQDTLVTCFGATFGDEDKPTRYHIRWQDDEGTHEERVLADELRLAPTLPEMKRRYDDALQVVYKQSLIIKEQEEALAILRPFIEDLKGLMLADAEKIESLEAQIAALKGD